jgi:hypothetical protein
MSLAGDSPQAFNATHIPNVVRRHGIKQKDSRFAAAVTILYQFPCSRKGLARRSADFFSVLVTFRGRQTTFIMP